MISTVLWDADGVLQRTPDALEESMRPALRDRVEDVEEFMAEALAAERLALTGDARWVDVLPGLLERWGIPEAYDDLICKGEPTPVGRLARLGSPRAGQRCPTTRSGVVRLRLLARS